jgi:hypothetical protein
MGEARRRKQADPNYGRSPKRSPARGLVVCPPLEIEGTRLHAKSSNLHPQELRFALLFWDKLVWPSSRAIHFASSPDEEFLQSARVLTRPDYTFNGDAAQGIGRGQIQAYLDCEQSEPGVWALAQGENALLLRDSTFEESAGAYVELHRAIPIPKHDVPLAEILEFKLRRRDELLLLRQNLDSFVSDIQAAADRSAALKPRIAEIDKACANLLSVGKEWQFPVCLSDFKASFSLSPVSFLPAVAAGWTLGQQYGLVAAAAAAASAGVASTLEINADYGLRSIRRPASPYRYAYRIRQEIR